MRLLWLGFFALSACTVVHTRLLPRTEFDPVRTLPEGIDVYSERLFYPVQAETAEQARMAVAPAAAVLGVKDRMQGFTRWRVTWTYDYAMSGGVCRVGKAKVDLLLRVVMPELFSAAPEDTPLRDRWLRYVSRLWLHEQGHVDHGVECARELKRVIEEHQQASCANIKDALNFVTEGVVDRFKALDVQYDAETRHGMAQGVQLP